MKQIKNYVSNTKKNENKKERSTKVEYQYKSKSGKILKKSKLKRKTGVQNLPSRDEKGKFICSNQSEQNNSSESEIEFEINIDP